MESQIFGISRQAVCLNGENCRNGQACKFRHPRWIINLCVYNLAGKCTKQHCDRQHEDWSTLEKRETVESSREIVLKSSQISSEFSAYQNRDSDRQGGTYKSNTKQSIQQQSILFREKYTQQRQEKVNRPMQTAESKSNESLNKQMKLLTKELKKTQNLDVLLFLDCTSSMGSWIEEAKMNLLTIIQQFRQKTTNFCFRVGFVGYRDFCDGAQQFVVQKFTENIDQVVELISQQKASGGGDSAEDFCGALQQALEFDFEKLHSLHCFLVCDYPCHGEQYHGPEVDDNTSNVEAGTLERLMESLKGTTQFARFTCFKITQHTDQMFQIMQKCFKDLEITNHSKPEEFSSLMISALQSTINTLNTRLTQNLSNVSQVDSIYLPSNVYDESKNGYMEVKQIVYKFPKIQKNMTKFYWEKIFPTKLREIEQTRYIKIKDSMFNEGMQSLVFDVEMFGCNVEFVVKIPKIVKEDVGHQLQQVKSRMVSSAYAYQLTRYFRQNTNDITDAPLLFYIPPMRFVLKDKFKNMTHLYAEPKLKNSEDFVKVSSNWDCCRKQTFASFSHYTFVATEGYLMVTDLQGVGFVLTDPAIQSEDKQKFQDPSNLGNIGIAQFFVAQHPKCNLLICQKLGLGRPEWESQIKQSLALIEPDQALAVEETNAVCEFCYSQDKVNLKEYRKKLQKIGFLFACEACRKDLNCQKKYECINCHTEFQDTPFFYACFGLKEPRKCKKCKAQKVRKY